MTITTNDAAEINPSVDPELPQPQPPSRVQNFEAVPVVIQTSESDVTIIPVTEDATTVTDSAVSQNGKIIPPAYQYIEILLNGNVIVPKTTAINFVGSGVDVVQNGSMANVTVVASANTGNWGFSNNSFYNFNGGLINNGDPSHGATSFFYFPPNGNTGSAAVLNYYGNFVVTVGQDPGATSAWRFDNTGNLVLPTNTARINYANGVSILDGAINEYGNNNVVTLLSSFGSNTVSTTGNVTAGYFLGDGSQLTGINANSNIIFNGTSNVDIATANGNVMVNVDGTHAWTFNTSGDLRTPPTTQITTGNSSGTISINNSDGSGDFAGIALGNYGSNNQYVNLTASDGNGVTVNLSVNSYTGATNEVKISIFDPGPATFTDWTFDNTGNLTTPANLVLVNDGSINSLNSSAVLASSDFDVQIRANANGVGTIQQWNFGTDGNFVTPGSVVLGNAVVANIIAQSSPMWITGSNGNYVSINSNLYSQLYWTSNIDNLDPFSGNDDYAWVEVHQDGIFIETNPLAGTQHQWTFRANGMIDSSYEMNVTGNVNVARLESANDLVANANVSASGNVIAAGFQYANGTPVQGSGAQGTTGAQGATGTNGTQGTTGAQGATGTNGTQGTTGAQGATGTQGTNGTIGAQGVQGITGTQGTTGAQGTNGTNGTQGTTGAQGATGSFSGTFTSNVNANSYSISNIGNITGTGNISTTGNVTASNFIGNISITGNVTGTSSNVELVAGSYTFTFDNTGIATFPTVGGDEGGEIHLGIPTANTTLQGSVKMDVYQDRIRFFEGSANAKGAYLDLANCANGVATVIGYRDIPQIAFSANATAAINAAGCHYYSTTAGNLALTLPDNSSVAFPTGATLTIVVNAAGNVLVNQGSGVSLYQAGASTTGNRVVGAYGLASVMKVAANTWVISGTGVY